MAKLKQFSRPDRHNDAVQKDSAGPATDQPQAIGNQAAAGGAAPVGTGTTSLPLGSAPEEPVTEDAYLFPDFDDFWQTLVERSPNMALAETEPETRIRGLTFGDLREALRDSFNAARATCGKEQS